MMRSSSALTVVELLAVLSIFSILLALAGTTIDQSRFAVRGAAEGLAANLSRVRFEAIQSNDSAFMTFSASGQGQYTIWTDGDADGVVSTNEIVTQVTFGEGDQALVRIVGLQEGSTAVETLRIGFDRRGFPVNLAPGRVTLSNRDGSFTRTVSYSVTGEPEVGP